ncbi:hypothetical protein AAF712_002077 [Marasmius tenuissimus]|uniref:RlpA-like protein double-psi beta-barrel domain-containing protein n=1 Tax=Marasmius tenuissimus TaxID=585030 RepID=A0ABR3AAC0_9AGAR
MDLPYKYRHDHHQVVEARSREHEDKKVRASVKVAQDAQNARKGRKKEKSNEGANTASPKKPAKPKTIPKLKAESILEPVAGSSGKKFRTSGEAEPVTITWYTGNDLLRPSCWANEIWTPTDSSFVCAVTLEGWKEKPQCFKFLELCNGPEKCIFVRVVDTCAGCTKGSKHVDLTKAAFSALASLDEGRLDNIQMRPALELPLVNRLW